MIHFILFKNFRWLLIILERVRQYKKHLMNVNLEINYNNLIHIYCSNQCSFR